MNKDEIISAFSIEFVISKEEAAKTVDTFFDLMTESIKTSKNLEISKFGEFKMISSRKQKDKSVIFYPAKRLSNSVNIYFSDLEEMDIKCDVPVNIDQNDEFDFHISKEFVKEKEESEKNQKEIESAEEEIVANGENMKKLISDELVKLHKEIIELGADEKRNNLWG